MSRKSHKVEVGFLSSSVFDSQYSNEAMRPYARFLSMIVLFAVSDYARSLLLDKNYATRPRKWSFNDRTDWNKGRQARRWMLGITEGQYPFIRIAELLNLDPAEVVAECDKDPKAVYARTRKMTAI